MISIVVPVYDEAEVLGAFTERLTKVLADLDDDSEIVFVDDGSTDGSLDVLRSLVAADRRIRVLSFSRNFGHQVAISAGIDAARGDAVVVIDADLQDPPEVIAEMHARWSEGNKVVYGVRTRRDGERPTKKLTARWFYRLLGRLSDTPMTADSGDFRLLDRQVVEALKAMREENRYLRGMVSWVGFTQCGVEYEREPRAAGETKYTWRRMLRFAADGITSFSDRPLRVAVQLGTLVTLTSFLYGGWLVIGKLINPDRSLPGYTSLLVAVLFLGGIQLLTIGILGSYIGRIYTETKRRPLYIVAETIER
ncbi:MAG: glycosyltransferase family 2 protein [Acidimicrobiales bacterium]